MELAIKEVVSSVVQHNVSKATQITKDLLLKDSIVGLDESRIRRAAHLVVKSLAQGLAHVTCKELLRLSIQSHLTNNLQALSGNMASELLEPAVQLVTNDSLDLGCAFIEQVATEKAVQTIDSELAPQLEIRRKQSEGVGPACFDTGLYTQGYTGVLPEALCPKPGQLSHSQQRVSEEQVSNHPLASRDDTNVLESSELDPAAFQEQVSRLFDEWIRIHELPDVNDHLSCFVLKLQQHGLLKVDDTSDWFFRRLLDIAVLHCISCEGAFLSHQQAQTPSFLAIDLYASLVFTILKFSDDSVLSKLLLFSKVLAVTVSFIQKDAEDKKTSFIPTLYFRHSCR